MKALVTGAPKRIGAAIARELAQCGFDVAVHYRSSKAEALQVVEDCRAQGTEAFALAADLTTVEGCRSVVEQVRARWSRLDLLVNNASLFEPVPFEEIDLDAWERMLSLHARAPLLLSQGLLPLLREAGGLVINLCDIGAEKPVRGYTPYSVSKAALLMLTRSMAVELAPQVRTIGISPGQVAWPESYEQALRDRLTHRIPMGRVGTPEEVAALVRFAALEGTYLNGAIIPVDGGLSSRY